MTTCPICGADTADLDRTSVAEGFDCPQHGKFKVAGTVLGSDAYLNAPRPQWEAALEKVRRRTIPDAVPCITTSDFL